MRLLALDTAAQRGSIAWLDGSDDAPGTWLGEGRGPQGHVLAPAVERLVGGRLHEIDGIALSIGPGSFTGLRIALSFVKGLCIARPIPVVTVSTLEAIAALHPDPTLAAIDARNGEVFARLGAEVPEGLYRIDDLVARLIEGAPRRLAGEPPPALVEKLAGWVVSPLDTPLAPVIGRLALPRFAAGEGRDPLDVQPSYGQPAAVDRARATVDTLASRT